jgi:hypothetical protein
MHQIVSGWRLSGIVNLQSGQAKTPVVGGDWAQIGGRRMQPLDRLGDGNDGALKSDIRNQPVLQPYFKITDFARPTAETLGNGGRGTIVGPGVNNWDFSLQKDFSIKEEVKLEFKAEFFNAFNHAQFVGLGLDIRAATFGRLTSARSPRSIQFGFKLKF